MTRTELAVDHPDERDDAPVLVVGRVEDQRARRGPGVTARRRDAVDNGVEHLGNALARLRRDAQNLVGRDSDELRELRRRGLGVRLRQVDLVHDGDDLEIRLDREVRVRDRLRLDPLSRVDEEDGALAGRERARDLVCEVDVTRRVDQVELVPFPGHTYGLSLDRDAALALEVHRVEHLLAHLPIGEGLRELEDAVGKRRLAVVDVRDDREVADAIEAHLVRPSDRRPERPINDSNAPSSRIPSKRAKTRYAPTDARQPSPTDST